jgi:aryl-alcohol dehydrogenase-like predicted oxidoreductase
MDYRELGRTGVKVSALCLGTMTFGEQNTEAEAHAQLDYALSCGINFIDTAELYPIPPKAKTQGRTEEIIGTWLKARGNRDKIILASKVVGRSGMTWFRDDKSNPRLNAKNIFEAIDKSLKRLQTDTIDLYQLHWPDRPMQWGANPSLPTTGRNLFPLPKLFILSKN